MKLTNVGFGEIDCSKEAYDWVAQESRVWILVLNPPLAANNCLLSPFLPSPVLCWWIRKRTRRLLKRRRVCSLEW